MNTFPNAKRIAYSFFTVCLIVSILLGGCSAKDSGKTGGSDNSSSSGTQTTQTTQATQPAQAIDNHESKYGGTLKIIGNLDATALGYPADLRAFEDVLYSGPALETLFRQTPSGVPELWLAEGLETDPDNLTIDITLRKGVLFHDGTELNAEAVKWNIEQFLASPRNELDDIISTEVVDPYHIRLTLSKWSNSIIDSISNFLFIVSPAATEKNGKEWASKHPVGTGPFRFVSWERDVSIKYEKFEHYWQEGKPYLDAIEIMIIPDQLSAAASFKNKEAHIYWNLTTEIAKDLEDFGADIIQNRSGLGGRSIGLIGDSINPDSPFSHVKVRQAVSYAIDREAIASSILYNYANVTNQWGSSAAWSYNPNIDIGYDPEKARQLLAEAGYPDGFTTTLTTDTTAEEISVMTAVQAYLKEVGIHVNISPVDRGRYVDLTSGGVVWDGLITWHGRADPDIGMFMPRNFASDGIIYKQGIISSERLDQLLKDILVEPDFETRKKIAHEVQQLVFVDLAMATSLYTTTYPAAMYPEVKDSGINLERANFWRPADVYLQN